MDNYTFDFDQTVEQPPSQDRHGGFLRTLLAGFLGALIALAGAYGLVSLNSSDDALSAPDDLPAPEAMPAIALLDEDFSPAAVGETVIPAIVTVEVGVSTANGRVSQGSGSGVIFDETGYIVTNDHVAGDADEIQVILADGRIYEATLIGTDPVTDLAVLDIDADGLEAIEFGATDTMTVGDPTVAIGSPLGLKGGPSLTTGVLSAFGREVQTSATTILYGMIQTDAPITQGSSGGALVDESGRLIGITTAVGVSDVGIEGIGFATPIEVVERVVADILDDGAVEHGLLGINGSTDFDQIADGGARPTGVVVDAVEPGSAADTAGIRLGDVITAVAGNSVDTMEELISALRRLGSGEAVMLEIRRGTGELELTATLGTL